MSEENLNAMLENLSFTERIYFDRITKSLADTKNQTRKKPLTLEDVIAEISAEIIEDPKDPKGNKGKALFTAVEVYKLFQSEGK